MPDSEVLSSVRLAPSEAISFFRQKLSVPTERWGELTSATHAQSFAVAGATSEALLNDFKTAVGRAISDGKTLAEFRKDFDGIVKRRGWQHTGTPGWRAKIIYETNLAAAYSAGRYKRMTTPEALELYPYWRYAHHSCQHPRPMHVAWSGTILRNDDPWWASHYPPNGWHCHCTVEVVSENRMQRNGWTVSVSPSIETHPWRNPATGNVEQVPVGIDPGFQSNQGLEWAKAEKERARVAMRPITHVDERPVDELPASVRRLLQKEQIAKFYGMKPRSVGNIEVGTLHPAIQAILGSRTAVVTMSDDNLYKNRPHHPEFTAQDYQRIPDIMADPDYVVEDNTAGRVILLNKLADGYYDRVSLKRTQDGSENYWLGLLYQDSKKAERMLRRRKVLYRKKQQDGEK